MNDTRASIRKVFREVFDDPTIELRDDMTADDIDGWDSMTHIHLITALEHALSIKFAIAEMSRMKQPGENVGSLVALIEAKVVPA
jgi:acyl carrier protein